MIICKIHIEGLPKWGFRSYRADALTTELSGRRTRYA